MRGQGAMEFLLIMAFILLLIVPVGYYIFSQTQESSRILQGDLAVSELAKTADYIYYQAPGAKQVVTVFLPGGVDWAESYIGHPTESGGKEINLAVYTGTGDATHIFEATQGEVRGTWPDSNGNWRFTVRKMPEGYVLLSPYELTFLVTPQSYTAHLEPLQSGGFTLEVEEIGGEDRTVTLTPQGAIASWMTLGETSLDLTGGSTNSTGVSITVPSGTPFGLYEGTVQVTDGEIEDSVFVTIVVTGTIEPIFGFGGGLDVNILSPENITYYDLPVNLTYTVNDTYSWCAYSIDGGVMIDVEGNTSLLPTGGLHEIFLRCVGQDGRTGADTAWFTAEFGGEPWCYNLTMLWAYNSDYDDIMSNLSSSDDIRGHEQNIKVNLLSFIEATFALALSGDQEDIAIHNMTEWIEHYEGSSQMTPILQWGMSTGWGATTCELDILNPSSKEAYYVCTLSDEAVPTIPGRVIQMSTRVFYLSQAATKQEAWVDHVVFGICYGEAMKWINIISPMNASYPTNEIWFNATTNAIIHKAWYSLDGAGNVTMNDTYKDAYKFVSVPEGSHHVVFYANDTNGNTRENETWFSVTFDDVTAPNVTITSPTNNTYFQPWVWVNATTDESVGWCGYSMDSGANVTMSGSGTSGYYNASVAYNSHDVKVFCNDTSGNMGSDEQWFTTSIGTYCTSLTLFNGYDTDGDNETTDLQLSNNIWAEDAMTKSNDPEYITSQFSGTIPGGATINNATAYVEHWEDYAGFSIDLQWNNTAWEDACAGITVRSTTSGDEGVDSCDLTGVNTVAEANELDLRMAYDVTLGGPTTVRTVYVDQMRVEVCYTA